MTTQITTYAGLLTLDPALVGRLVRAALEEDGAFNDITTQTTVPPDQRGRGVFLAKDDGVLAGLGVAEAAFRAVDADVAFTSLVHEGAALQKGDIVATVEGRLAAILSAERVALNFLQRLSGTATLTRALVDAVGGLDARVVDTRKTTPGLRYLERYAVRAGGGHNHRYNLSDGVLIKDNHIAAGRSRGLSIGDVIAAARAGASHTQRIEVEVASLGEAVEAVEAGADIILLDNMTPAQMAEAVHAIDGRALTEASGGVTRENIREVAEARVDIISSGAITHSAKALDISLTVETTRG
jgi:nicotinate-nucleotide pyrophosphorylase (carboxylating)